MIAAPLSAYTGFGDRAPAGPFLAPGPGIAASKAPSGRAVMSWLSNLFAKEPRREGREHKTFPVKVIGDRIRGVTRDLSLSGVYFEIGGRYQVGSMIKMTIDFDSPLGMQLECEGTIVRVEGCGSSKVGVAVRMNDHKVLSTTKQKSLSPRTRAVS